MKEMKSMRITLPTHCSHSHFEGTLQWCVTLPATSVHSFDQLIKELACAFYRYNHRALNKKFLKLWKAPHESVEKFHKRFHNISFQIPKDEIDWKFLNDIFEYLLHISENPHILESFKPLPTYIGVRDAKSKTYKVVVTSDLPSTSHQIALTSYCKVGEGAHTSIKISHLPTPPALDICVDLC